MLGGFAPYAVCAVKVLVVARFFEVGLVIDPDFLESLRFVLLREFAIGDSIHVYWRRFGKCCDIGSEGIAF